MSSEVHEEKFWSPVWYHWDMVELLKGGSNGNVWVTEGLPSKGVVAPQSLLLFFAFCPSVFLNYVLLP